MLQIGLSLLHKVVQKYQIQLTSICRIMTNLRIIYNNYDYRCICCLLFLQDGRPGSRAHLTLYSLIHWYCIPTLNLQNKMTLTLKWVQWSRKGWNRVSGSKCVIKYSNKTTRTVCKMYVCKYVIWANNSGIQFK